MDELGVGVSHSFGGDAVFLRPVTCATRALLVAAVAFGLFGGAAFADNDKLKVTPFEFDPDRACDDQAQWRPGIGLPDAGSSNHGLVLKKGCALAVNAAAGASIDGAAGIQVTAGFTIGYDIRSDSPCGGGAPRFNLSTTASTFHFVGACVNDNERTPNTPSAGWTRVRFELQDVGEAFPVVPVGAVIQRLSIIVDEPGEYVLDNIYINGVVIGQPGNSR